MTKIKTKKCCVASQIFQNVGHLLSYSTSKVKAFRIIVKHNLHRGAGWKVMPQNLNRFAYIANSGSWWDSFQIFIILFYFRSIQQKYQEV